MTTINFQGRGLPGKSAYQHWLDDGNVGTMEDFLATLVGEDGLMAAATAEEVQTGTDEAKALTPASLAEAGLRWGSGVEHQITVGGWLLKRLGADFETLVGAMVKPSTSQALQVRLGGVWTVLRKGFDENPRIASAPVRTWVNSLYSDSFGVASDIRGAGRGETRLIVGNDDELKDRLYISDATLPTLTARDDYANYGQVKLDAGGLEYRAAAYYYALEVDGVRGPIQSVKLLPPQGQAASFKYILASCSAFKIGTIQSLVAMKEEEANAVWFIGDLQYDDPSTPDPRYMRERGTRGFRSLPEAADLLTTTALFYMPHNHDLGMPGTHKGYGGYPVGSTHENVTAASRKVYRETVNHYELADPDGSVLAFLVDSGPVRAIFMDTISERDPSAGTMLGAFQLQWVKDKALEAGALGLNRLIMVTPDALGVYGWASNGGAYLPELIEILTLLRDSPGIPATIWNAGDDHYSGLDDGGIVAAILADTTMPVWMSSAAYATTDSIATITPEPWSWNGTDTQVYGPQELFLPIVVDASGEMTATLKGAPYTSGVPTTYHTVSTVDRLAVAQFSAAAASGPASTPVEIELTKDWQGSVDGCVVEWATSNGQSGTVTFRPNSAVAVISVVAPASGSITVELTSATRCTLGAQTTLTLTAA